MKTFTLTLTEDELHAIVYAMKQQTLSISADSQLKRRCFAAIKKIDDTAVELVKPLPGWMN